MHVAFIKFHNHVVKLLQANGCAENDLFEFARTIVVEIFSGSFFTIFCVSFYKQTFWTGSLKTSLVFHRKDGGHVFMPLEFSAAAFRLGHTMVRAEYSGIAFIQLMRLVVFRGSWSTSRTNRIQWENR